MIIHIANLTLRFFVRDDWTEDKVRKLLVNPKMEVTFRSGGFPKLGNSDYYAVYEDSGHKVFKKSETDKHTFENMCNHDSPDWYINKEE